MWIPPDGTELTEQEEDALDCLLTQTVGPDAATAILDVYEQLDEAHPQQPCFYLTLLGVREDQRGNGLGMGLLAESLAHIDALGAPAYLESSNPVNNARYESVGFIPRDEITIATGHVVTTMWRPPH